METKKRNQPYAPVALRVKYTTLLRIVYLTTVFALLSVATPYPALRYYRASLRGHGRNRLRNQP